jgi:propanol-preferring alcohol dehydrogenase
VRALRLLRPRRPDPLPAEEDHRHRRGALIAILGRSRDGEAQAKDLGAERYVATDDTDPADALRGWDGGADLIVNAAPSSAAAQAAFGGLAPDGTLLLLGYAHEPLSLPTSPMVLGRLHVIGNPSGSPHDLRDTLAFAAAHGILPEVAAVSLDQAPDLLAAMAAGIARGRSVITF